MGIFIIPIILLMAAGPLAPFFLFPGEFTYELGKFALEVMDFFWITIPEFLGISLF